MILMDIVKLTTIFIKSFRNIIRIPHLSAKQIQSHTKATEVNRAWPHGHHNKPHLLHADKQEKRSKAR